MLKAAIVLMLIATVVSLFSGLFFLCLLYTSDAADE